MRPSSPLWSHANQDILCQTHRPAVYKRHTISPVSPLPARGEGGGRGRSQNPVPHVTREHASRQNTDQPEGESRRKSRTAAVPHDLIVALLRSSGTVAGQCGKLRPVEFEWDLEKEIQNIRKHRVSFTEAVESFLDPHGIQVVDSKHSAQEKRLYWVGRISTGRILTTRFTKRGNKIRLIGSAEWRKFRRFYHETPKSQSPEN